MSGALSAIAVGSGALGIALAWLAWHASRLDTHLPDRLVMELRLAQYSALLLVLTGGVYVGLGIAHGHVPGSGLDVAIAIGFFVAASAATTWEPTRALTVLALAWGGHALVDIAHLANVLPAETTPSWYATGCAIYDVCVGALSYLPVLRR